MVDDNIIKRFGVHVLPPDIAAMIRDEVEQAREDGRRDALAVKKIVRAFAAGVDNWLSDPERHAKYRARVEAAGRKLIDEARRLAKMYP
jgi:hypothetical protein